MAFLLAMAVIAPTVGDFGLTYDEPAYRYSQLVSVQWWQRLARARSGADVSNLLTPDALLYYWPYARHGINFHPPLAGQLNLLTYGVFGGVLKDIPARRMASAIELALTATLIFAFIGRRYGVWAGAAAGAALVLMPRVYGQAHLIDTDMPGMLLWVAGAFAFWKGLKEPDGARWHVAVGVLAGLAFIEKMAAVFFLGPILVWLVVGHLLPALRRPRLGDWLNADLITIALMLMPLIVAFLEIRRLARLLPPPQFADLFFHRPPSRLAGAVLLAPLGFWLLRRGLEQAFRRAGSRLPERPALEMVGDDLGVWSRGGADWVSAVVARDVRAAGALLHAEYRPGGCLARYPHSVLRADVHVQPAAVERVGVDGDHGARFALGGRDDRAGLRAAAGLARRCPARVCPAESRCVAVAAYVADAGP